ncbi:1-(5-phosphoribosyl)-5-[(5-phosphoribosylamino)methylideneamino]imidazole-4-carboxamide isomerase [Sporosarcina gallistercoris]|uniref:1-(5-phosphoribosyl)-5-[(5-phosphoribosylamino)methylideneamino] imidazole-4-carboxamide isomerase n=1 Tax=Sporosarcina gallistercoris TaxID=2762245 RepID=A0ABR8PI54_9BACL|nr:1-(5-phosphoribosyl)-5-[(5-phosphoribosylamino)methylideneamino]imidazole-4-carboxamide isomerase [Sporosarcina gallistercoris]MBD7907841.1 1-(5-phosphoribosyl)-5-[(5-phosphoribosylamino)methylideneamino]imidazole-4-carboxamide isomerase [Sporosarcina gallistercoris]
MILFPAIDIQNGKCVRLVQGDFKQETIYHDSPLEVGKKWLDQGAEWLHVVDLDGAKTGQSVNREAIIELANTLQLPIQVGGGIRTIEAIEDYLSNGVERIILGTSAIKDPDLLKQAVTRYGKRIAVSVDAKNGKPTTAGWTEDSTTDVSTLVRELEQAGVQTIIYTDIAKDGMLAGPNFEELQSLQKETEMDIIASGGVTTVRDIEKLQQESLYGAIVGKAIYENGTRFQEMMEVL